MRFLLITILAILPGLAYAQESVDKALRDIAENNRTLKALYKKRKAEKRGAMTGIYPVNPEVELGFLKASPGNLSKRTDLKVTQSFDFPLAYIYKRKAGTAAGNKIEWQWKLEKKNLLFKARLICLDLIFTNAMERELGRRMEQAEQIASAVKSRFSRGEANILELNKVKLNLLNVRKEVELNRIQREALKADLKQMNGGKDIIITDTGFTLSVLSRGFKEWYKVAESNNVELQLLRSEVVRMRARVKLERALSLPKFSIGYMSESAGGESYKGATVGVSVPLFEHKNRVKSAKAGAEAAEQIVIADKMLFYNRMEAQYRKVVAIGESVRNYRKLLAELDHSELLKKAMDKGEISLPEYIFELSQYNESRTRLIEAEREYGKAMAVLKSYSDKF